jgi:GntR family transcriptional regulator
MQEFQRVFIIYLSYYLYQATFRFEPNKILGEIIMSSKSILAFNIIHESTTPLYYQLFTLIKNEIQNSILKPGDLLPPESQLCSQYNLSRSTVRQALTQLVKENLVIRRRGKGSYVADKKLNRNLNHLYNFTEDMFELGLYPHSNVLENRIEDSTADIAKKLNLHKEKIKVFKLFRLRLANDEPLLLEITHIPLYLCTDIVIENFSDASLYNFLKTRYNLNLYKAVETYEAVKLNKEMAQLLNCKSGTCAFKIQRIAYLDSGIPFELTNSYQKGIACKFKVELYANQNKINFSRETKVE